MVAIESDVTRPAKVLRRVPLSVRREGRDGFERGFAAFRKPGGTGFEPARD